MSEELNQVSTYQSGVRQNVFHTEMFGFKRNEVLACIERLTADAQKQQHELEDTIVSLHETLEITRHDTEFLKQERASLQEDLLEQQNLTQEAIAKADALKQELEETKAALHVCREQLAQKEHEAVAYTIEREKLRDTVHKLNEAITEHENNKEELQQKAEQLREEMANKLAKVRSESDEVLAAARQRVELMRNEAETQASVIRAKAEEDARKITIKAEEEASIITSHARQQKVDSKRMMSDSADNIAASIVVLKSELAAVDDKIIQAKDSLKKATGCIANALSNAERDLTLLGVQMEKFPVSMPAVEPIQPPPPAPAPPVQEPAPVLNYTQNPALQDSMHAQQRAIYTQNNDVYDQQRYAYEQQQEAYRRRCQEEYYAAEQRKILERETYERVQREVQEKLQREAYDQEMRDAFERRQRDAFERAQREAFEQQQRAVYEAQQRMALQAQQQAEYEARQRAAYAPAYQPHYPQAQPFAPFPQNQSMPPYTGAYQAPQYQPQSQVGAPTPIAPPVVQSFSQPPSQTPQFAQQPAYATPYGGQPASPYATMPTEPAKAPVANTTTHQAPFEKQQAFSAPKEMQDLHVRKVAPTAVRRAAPQPPQRTKSTLSDTLLDGLTSLLNNK